VRRAAVALVLLLACGKKPSPDTTTVASAAPAPRGAIGAAERPKIDAAEIAVPPGKSELHVAWSVPKGTVINDEAPFKLLWTSSDGLVDPPTDIKGHGQDVVSGFEIPIDVLPDSSGAKLSGDLDIVVCDDVTHSVCVPIKRRVELTFAVGAKGAPKGMVALPLPSAKP